MLHGARMILSVGLVPRVASGFQPLLGIPVFNGCPKGINCRTEYTTSLVVEPSLYDVRYSLKTGDLCKHYVGLVKQYGSNDPR